MWSLSIIWAQLWLSTSHDWGQWNSNSKVILSIDIMNNLLVCLSTNLSDLLMSWVPLQRYLTDDTSTKASQSLSSPTPVCDSSSAESEFISKLAVLSGTAHSLAKYPLGNLPSADDKTIPQDRMEDFSGFKIKISDLFQKSIVGDLKSMINRLSAQWKALNLSPKACMVIITMKWCYFVTKNCKMIGWISK